MRRARRSPGSGGIALTPTTGVSAQNSTVDRALRVLQVFLEKGNDLGVLEIAAALDLDKSVVHRILATLVRRRFLEQDHTTRKYRVGLRVWELGRLYVSGVELEELAMERLTTLLANLSYTAGALGILDGVQVVVLTWVRGAGPFNITLEPGLRLPAALTATGRAMLAYLPAGELEALSPALLSERRQHSSIRSMPDLLAELARIREQGYATNRGEYFPGVATVAACIRDRAGRPLLGISVEFPAVPETETLWDILPDRLSALARELEESLPDTGAP
jgi:IclR family transcriptional regulator, KDG regulon repressor